MSLTLLKDQFGILLVNLGTPEHHDVDSIKRYLKQFLSDRRVIDLNPIIWYPVLHGIILPFRSKKLSHLYQAIWTENGSPLFAISCEQKKALSERFPEMPIELGMTYGSPSIEEGLNKLKQQDVHTIVVLPLYPQYSSTTTAVVWDTLIQAAINAVNRSEGKKAQPEVAFVRDYADHPLYIKALADSVERSFSQYGKPEKLVISYHGIPQRYADDGDEYPLRCELTTQKLVEALNLTEDEYIMTYQSRFGFEPWLQPYTDKTMQALAAQGIKHIHIMCPGFSSDCLETLEEIEVQNRQLFIDAGGERFHYIPALNAGHLHIDLLAELVKEKL